MTALPMAGRTDELDAVAGAWARVVDGGGRSQVVVVTGAAGTGKSRLVAEAVAGLVPAPACVLAGQARTHAPAPYDWTASALSGRSLADLPVPADALAWLTQRPAAPPRRFAPGALLRVAVDAVRGVLGEGPGVLVVEDLHDLDPASLALVADLAAAHPLPALLLVTSRAADEAAFPALAARVLARLTGTPRSVRRHLPPLSPAEVATVIEAAAGTVPPPDVVLAAHHRTGGNAFWLIELVTAYRGAGPAALAGAPLPDHVAALVVDRLAGEPQPTVRLARAAALLGDRLSPDDLDELAGDGPGGAEPAVRRLVDLGLLVLGPAGEPRFRYPLIHEAIAATALPATRLAVYRQVRDLARARGDDAALARYARELGHREEAAAAAHRAATAHLAAARPTEALRAAEDGLAAISPEPATGHHRPATEPPTDDRRPATDSPTGDRRPGTADPLPLVRLAVAAATAAGRFADAAGYAARWRATATDPADLAAAHLATADVCHHLGRTTEQRTHLDTAATLTNTPAETRRTTDGPDGENRVRDGADRARYLAADAWALLGADRAAEAAERAEEALAAAPTRTDALVTRAIARLDGDRHVADQDDGDGVAELREAYRLAAERRDMVALPRAVAGLVGVEVDRLGEAAAWRAFDEAVATLDRYGMAQRAGPVVTAGVRLALRHGDLRRARALVDARFPVEPDRTERVVLAAVAGLLAVEDGDDALAVRRWERARSEAAEVDRPRALRHAAYLKVVIAARTAGPAEAVLALADYAREHRRGLADAARWALRAGAPPDRVRPLLAGAAGAAGLPGAALATGVAGVEGAAGASCVLLAAEGADEKAIEAAAAAGDGPAWRVAEDHVVAARCLLRLGHGDEALGHADRAAELLRRWPGWRRDEAAELLAAVRAGAELTAREREVLGCVATGMTNQQVARSLGISIRTVGVHVSNLLRKTGSASRTEAALWAVRHGLTGRPTT